LRQQQQLKTTPAPAPKNLNFKAWALPRRTIILNYVVNYQVYIFINKKTNQ